MDSFYRQSNDMIVSRNFFFLWVTLQSIIQDKLFQHCNRVINMSKLYMYIGITKIIILMIASNGKKINFDYLPNGTEYQKPWKLFLHGKFPCFIGSQERNSYFQALYFSCFFLFCLVFISVTKTFSFQSHYFINAGLCICTTFLSFCLNTLIHVPYSHFEIIIQ